ncbi:hypothetical protein CLAFUW4_09724 [Fulvia fulva]|uniref:Uncharacterized protein n=1 Tax=Passalora fulva TaxID=5499 RepID=A0A9Q8PHU3_PASFU|nr:uncharacterized protein CLAFUR5_12514 [Fulvia fulva]KAK4616023.1 hypothetical protein CLAFUR4_09729 [Fulvia fulva]KAK4617051.1 hypothetical protein CLAFUR0_09720 [Fulvia fulva]UJO22699.1 hypothetical protein CLAFUR5_12514 [Fulvia fulva]WPV19588.1 hypothetical protein CLAFUW4_09724 [Fulvia fulva]WPV33684.1 hypothetical protein CLAFUW7_09725 [Fulvia fulva]
MAATPSNPPNTASSNYHAITDPRWKALATKLYISMWYPSEASASESDIPDDLAMPAAGCVTQDFERALGQLAHVYEVAQEKGVPIERLRTAMGSYDVQTPQEINMRSEAEARGYALRILGAGIAASKAWNEAMRKMRERAEEMGGA